MPLLIMVLIGLGICVWGSTRKVSTIDNRYKRLTNRGVWRKLPKCGKVNIVPNI